MNRAHVVLVVLAAAALPLAGCSSAPGKVVDVHDVLLYAPASVSSDEATLQVCLLPARRCATKEEAPGGKTLLAVPLTRTDGTKGDPVYAAALAQPSTLAMRAPWYLTLGDGFLRVEVANGKLRASVEGARNPSPPPIVAEGELWVWVGNPPTKDDPYPRGTFVGARLAK